MPSSIPAVGPQITIINGTRLAVWVAIYKRSPLRVNEPPVAWEVVCPPSRGKTTVFIPQDYQVCARYSFEPERPRRPVYQTNTLQMPHAPAGAGFVIEGVSLDRRTWGAVLKRATESPGEYQVHIVNQSPLGVWAHVRQNGRDIFPPRVLPPKAALTEDLSSSLYLAVLPVPRVPGDRLRSSEIALTEIAIKEGESVKIQGGPFRGFKVFRIHDGSSSLIRESDGRRQALEKRPKAQASKKKVKKREPAKKPVSRRKTKKTPPVDSKAAPDDQFR